LSKGGNKESPVGNPQPSKDAQLPRTKRDKRKTGLSDFHSHGKTFHKLVDEKQRRYSYITHSTTLEFAQEK
jgi:hypothetical protein